MQSLQARTNSFEVTSASHRSAVCPICPHPLQERVCRLASLWVDLLRPRLLRLSFPAPLLFDAVVLPLEEEPAGLLVASAVTSPLGEESAGLLVAVESRRLSKASWKRTRLVIAAAVLDLTVEVFGIISQYRSIGCFVKLRYSRMICSLSNQY